ncbi:MAG: hypothetical protein CMJ19_10970 [Phycisphaeraceae bacterium]|nr:hypothetical protein [Phycisphaeraceae bacterium]
MANRFTQLTLLVLLAVMVTGCQTVNTYEPAESKADKHIVFDKRVITDDSLSNKAQLQQLISSHTPDGFLRVQAQLYNGTNKRAKFNYRFEWFDEAGMLIDTPLSTWKQISLAGRETSMIQGMAPTKNTVDFKLKLLEPGS